MSCNCLRIQLPVAAFFGFTAVLLGALGAHALEGQLLARETTSAWQTAALYHLVHAVALFALALFSSATGRSFSWTFRCWTGGILLFSGSLYLLALGGPSFLGPVTPLGGLLFLAGWVSAAFGGRKNGNETADR